MSKKMAVYAVLHVPSGSAYVGGSTHVTNRFGWHRCMLRQNSHTSVLLQRLWNRTKEREWVFVVLEFCRGEKSLRLREQQICEAWPARLLNDRTVTGFRISEKTKRRMSSGRARYLEAPGARKKLSDQAKRQHARGELGRATWKS